jgi:hypothetical protein
MGEMELPWKNALQYPKTQTLLSVPSATSLPFVAFLTAEASAKEVAKYGALLR